METETNQSNAEDKGKDQQSEPLVNKEGDGAVNAASVDTGESGSKISEEDDQELDESGETGKKIDTGTNNSSAKKYSDMSTSQDIEITDGDGNNIISSGGDTIQQNINIFTKPHSGKENKKEEEKERKINKYDADLVTRDIPTIYKNYKNKELEFKHEELLRSRIMIINSLDKHVLYAIQNILINEIGGYGKNYDIYALPFLGQAQNLELKDLKYIKIGKGRRFMLLLAPHDDFFSEVDRNHVESIKKSLLDKNILVVCMISKAQEEVDKEFPFLSKEYVYWHIPFPNEMIASEFGIEGKPLIQKVKESKSYQYKEEVVYKKLSEKIKGYKEEFKTYVENLDENIDDDYEQQLNKLKKTFDTGDKITKVVLFVSSFFTHLDFREFNFVITKLLEGKVSKASSTNKRNKKVAALLEATPLLHQWVDQVLVEDVYLIDKWKDESSDILKRCSLQHTSILENVYSIEFALTGLKVDLRAYIEEKYFPFVYHSYEQINQLQLLFNLDLRNRLVKSILFITVYYSRYERERYDENWLINIVDDFAKFLDNKYGQKKGRTQTHFEDRNVLEILGALYEELQRLEERKKLNKIIKAFNQRLADLIEEMFSQDTNYFKRIVDQFLIHLINIRKFQKVAIEIVLTISKNLEHKFEFDTGKYLKHLFNQAKGNDSLLIGTYYALFASFNIEALKEYLESWIPESTDEIDEGNHKLFAVIFQLDYTILGIVTLEDKYLGEFPTTFPLLQNLDQKDNPLSKCIRWLLDDRMEKAMSKDIAKHIISERLKNYFGEFVDSFENNDPNNFDYEAIKLQWISTLIEFWFIILHGLDTTTPQSPEQKDYQDQYINVIKEELSAAQLKKVKNFLMAKKKDYGDIISNINQDIISNTNHPTTNTTNRDRRQELKETKSSVKNLRTILDTLRNHL